MAPPFHAEQIGSLIRPPALLEIQNAAPRMKRRNFHSSYAEGSAEKEIEKQAIADVVATQLSKGIFPVTNGEFPRHIFYDGFYEKLGGFRVVDVPIRQGYRTGFPTGTRLLQMGVATNGVMVCEAEMEASGPAYLAEWMHLRRLVGGDMAHLGKMTVPSPTWQHIQLKQGWAYGAEAYRDDRGYFGDLAKVYREEVKALYGNGCRNVQVDDPNLTFFAIPEFQDGLKEDGVEWAELLDLYIWVHNECIKDRPRDLHVGIHLCRGNFPNSGYLASGGYDPIAKKMFNEMDYDTFYLEYDTERAGSFEPLKFLPRGKNVILGLISTKSAEMEDYETIKAKVYEAADIIAQGQGISRQEALDCLGVSPQCGFSSSTVGWGKGVTEAIMWQKLEMVRDLAVDIWGKPVTSSPWHWRASTEGRRVTV